MSALQPFFLFLLLTVAGAATALADDAQPAAAGDNDAPKSLFEQDTLTGDWGGARKTLNDDGIVLGADEIFDAMGNPSGGAKQGMSFESRFEIFANVDLGAALGWKGGIFHANAYRIDGYGLSADDLGNLLTITNIGATPSTRLFTLWVQQSLLDDTFSIRLGQIAADDEFFVSQYAGLFLNSTFGWPGILGINLPSGGPAYPMATPGVRARWAATPEIAISTAVLNGDPAPAGTGDPQRRDAGGTAFRLNGGVFWINELAFAASIPLFGDTLPGIYKMGAWYHNGMFADQRYDTSGLSLGAPASNGLPALHRGNFGGYVIADQLLHRNSGNSDQGLAAFARAGGDPSDRNLIEFHADAGLSDVGLLPGRDNDVAGIAMSYERISGARDALVGDINAMTGAKLPSSDFESALELSYQTQIAPWWVVQPDLQVILHPNARLPNLAAPRAPTKLPDALVLGMRTAISF